MAAFTIPEEPDFDVDNIEEVQPTDRILYSFINSYYQKFLQNDKYLQNQVGKMQTAVDTLNADAELNTVTTNNRLSALETDDSTHTRQIGDLQDADEDLDTKISTLQDAQSQYEEESKSTFVSGVTYKGHTVTVTKGDGTAASFDTADENTTYSAATQKSDGLLTAADKKKLDGIADGATKDNVSNATITIVQGSTEQTFTLNGDAKTITLSNDNTTYTLATDTTDGLMSAADKKKLDSFTEAPEASTDDDIETALSYFE